MVTTGKVSKKNVDENLVVFYQCKSLCSKDNVPGCTDLSPKSPLYQTMTVIKIGIIS